MLHVDLAALTDESQVEIDGAGEGCAAPRSRARIADGPALARETLERVLCDCSVVELVEKGGDPLNVGRKTRKIPTATRRALEIRDEGCRWPGCNRKRFTDAHHVQHWTRDGGETKLPNLMLLCRIHHRMVHEEGFDIVLEPGGEVRVFRPDGIELPRVAFMYASGTDLEERQEGSGLTVDTETCMTLSHEAMDHGGMVESLLQTERLKAAIPS